MKRHFLSGTCLAIISNLETYGMFVKSARESYAITYWMIRLGIWVSPHCWLTSSLLSLHPWSIFKYSAIIFLWVPQHCPRHGMAGPPMHIGISFVCITSCLSFVSSWSKCFKHFSSKELNPVISYFFCTSFSHGQENGGILAITTVVLQNFLQFFLCLLWPSQRNIIELLVFDKCLMKFKSGGNLFLYVMFKLILTQAYGSKLSG